MGRWSRPIASLFLDWLALPTGLNWLDVGCGTGALCEAICRRATPQSIVGCDPSPDFVFFARNSLPEIALQSSSLPELTTCRVTKGGFDVVVSGLLLNFLPEPLAAVQSMVERLRPGGTVAAYVWDYADGM